MAKTLYDKLWESHIVDTEKDGTTVLYIDRQLLHEVTSPQAFEGLRMAGRRPWRNSANLLVADHNVSTQDRDGPIKDPVSRLQIETLDANAKEFGLTYFNMHDKRQGIVHVIGPEQGATLPGMTVVCGDSHTATHGAFGALAHGIGTSEVEHVLATQTLLARKMKTMLVKVEGTLQPGVSAKDIALAVIGKIGTAGGTGCAMEFAGSAIRALSMEGRMTLCNMAIEAGARAGLVAVDQTTIDYVKGRPYAPKGDQWEKAVAYWNTLHSDPDAVFDFTVELDAAEIKPQVTWGTSPEMVVSIEDKVPDPADEKDPVRRDAMVRALKYIGLEAGTPMESIMVDKVFIGSCTNGRLDDLRCAAEILKGRHIKKGMRCIVIPAAQAIYMQAMEEGLLKTFIEAGAIVSTPTCGPCLGGYMGVLAEGERCVSTTNRNFVGRMGHINSEIYLASPAVAAARAITGKISCPCEL